MTYTFDFKNDNVFAIYARNGMMKTSFARTFKCIQKSNIGDIKDLIFNIAGVADIKIDTKIAKPEDIFVINSFENSFQADVTPLLLKESIKVKLDNVLKIRSNLYKKLEKYSGLKVNRKNGEKTIPELENTLVADFNLENKSFLININVFKDKSPIQDLFSVKYDDIFKESVIKKIKTHAFQNKIKDFLKQSDTIYDSYPFLEKGDFTISKLKNINKSLKDEHYFINKNELYLSGEILIDDTDKLYDKINEIEGLLQTTDEYKEINKMLSDVGGTTLRDIIENNPDIIALLEISKLQLLKQTLWISYLNREKELMNSLCEEYALLSEEINSIDLNDTQWRRSLEIFNKRFSVPYQMEISNLPGSIIGECIPQINFIFNDGTNIRKIDRNTLDSLQTLSRGEMRALYLLNIIFELEEIKQSGNHPLYIVDDIADSFDYKNKYAIIEYLHELAQDKDNKIIIMSHNFDFYRTVSSRLGLDCQNRLFADSNNGNITLRKEQYQYQPFKAWKKNITEKNTIALIPFVRNLVEYGQDFNISKNQKGDLSFLTDLLHEKQNTNGITFGDIVDIYKQYLGTDISLKVDLNKKILVALYNICDNTTTKQKELEDKIILSMGIRHKAESHMIKKINNHVGAINWIDNKGVVPLQPADYINKVMASTNQTRTLFNAYIQIHNGPESKLLESVEIMTPENIHLNSFMYEPLIDMDINELLLLYNDIKTLSP